MTIPSNSTVRRQLLASIALPFISMLEPCLAAAGPLPAMVAQTPFRIAQGPTPVMPPAPVENVEPKPAIRPGALPSTEPPQTRQPSPPAATPPLAPVVQVPEKPPMPVIVQVPKPADQPAVTAPPVPVPAEPRRPAMAPPAARPEMAPAPVAPVVVAPSVTPPSERARPATPQGRPASAEPAMPNPQPRAGVRSETSVAAPAAGAFIAAEGFLSIDEIRQRRQLSNENGRTYIREPGRTIIREDNRTYIRHDENARFLETGTKARSELQGSNLITSFIRADGSQIRTVTAADGRLLRRSRWMKNGREVVLIDNTRPQARGPANLQRSDIVTLAALAAAPTGTGYILDARNADERLIYETLIARPIQPLPTRYTLDEVRSSPDLRNRMRSVDIDTITFETGSWTIAPNDVARLASVGQAMKRVIQSNANQIFLIEGYTDAVGNEIDNLSLSDRRAQSVAMVLSSEFAIPPENMTTQGYGEQFLKVKRQGDIPENRRATVRRITPLLNGGTATR